MTNARVVETSVTVNNNGPSQDYVHLDDQTQPAYEMCSTIDYPFITQLSNASFTYGCFKNHCVNEYN